jgi:hypothetical protein
VRRVLANPHARAQRFAYTLRRRQQRSNHGLRLKPIVCPRIPTRGWRLVSDEAEPLDAHIRTGVWLPQQPG